VMKVASGRYVYEHIFTDNLYRTNEPLNWGVLPFPRLC
jgi:hypothetical protein